VVEFHADRAPAHSAGGDRRLATSTISLEHLAPHVGGDVVRILRRARLLPRLLHAPVPLRVPLEQEVDAGLDDLREACIRVRVRERVAGEP
jgi:hypothetical protein